MFDIDFFMKTQNIRKKIINKEATFSEAYQELEKKINKVPVVFNIETTNVCNMRCSFCPRTSLMTRKTEKMIVKTFKSVVDQLQPHDEKLWAKWEKFIKREYNIDKNEMSQDHFFMYIIPKVITLHGFGEPLLDSTIAEKVQICTDKNIPTYFSCNPSNIKMDKAIELFKSGISYIKFSIDSIDDDTHKKLRGQQSNFTESYNKILELSKLKKDYPDTTIVITMINLTGQNKDEWEQLKEKFKEMNAYVYLKDQDQVWYDDTENNNQSIDWNQFCCAPWYSMTIKSNGDCVSCQEDYNNEIVFGNVKKTSLKDIWNNGKYVFFRAKHALYNSKDACGRQCDKKTVSDCCL